MFDAGADVVYHAAGGSGGGLFEAAAGGRRRWPSASTPTSTTPPRPTVQDVILTSMLKQVDVAVFDFLPAFADGDRRGRPARLRPRAGRRRLLHLRRQGRRHQGPARRVQAEDHRRRDHGPRPTLSPPRTTTGSAGRASVPPGPVAVSTQESAIAELTAPRDPGDPADRRDVGRRADAASPSASPASSPTATSTCAVRAGTVHAIVGENGAGKSTLMKILYGMQRPDEGTDPRRRPRGALRATPATRSPPAIGMVHQHFMLADNLTVLENVVLGSEPRTAGVALDFGDRPTPHPRDLRRRTASASSPTALVDDLGVGERQRVEILKVLYRGARILILDEPTAVLVPHEVDELFDNLRELKAEGLTVLFISHKLDEVLSVADDDHRDPARHHRRHGRPARRRPRGSSPSSWSAASCPSPETRESTVTDDGGAARRGPDRARRRRPRRRRRRRRSSSTRGEVLGLAGVEGNGQAELVEALIGMRRADAGARSLRRRQDITRLVAPAAAARAASATSRRTATAHGLLLDAPLWENRVLGHQTEDGASRGPVDRPGRRPRATPSAIVERVRRAHARHRRARPARCPAATSRSSSSAAR